MRATTNQVVMTSVGSVFSAYMCLAAVGCSATVTHTRLRTSQMDADDKGIRYLGTSPYLIAYSDGKGGIVTQIAYLPDPAKKMSAQPSSKMTDVTATMEFDRGVLTTSTETGDATAVSKAIIQAVEAFAPQLLKALNKVDTTNDYSVPAPYLFKIVVRGNDVYFLGGAGDTPIKITLVPKEK